MWKLMRYGTPLLLLIALILIGMALWTPNTVHAELKATAVVDAWDIGAMKYEHSNVSIYFDGSWEPFLHELGFDRYLFNTSPYEECVNTTGITDTALAGVMEYGLYHTDNAPQGAPGFQETRNWWLVDCDRDGDGDWDGDDRSLQPPQFVTVVETLTPLWQDVVVNCTTGNCQDEIVTTLFVNLDKDCDGTKDATYPQYVCFYAEARTPYEPIPAWSGPLQARISAGGGDKTVSFSPQTLPTGVNLASLTATWDENVVRVAWETTMEVHTAGFNLWRSTIPNGGYVRVNGMLIPSASPGGMQGAAYSYTDADVSPGTVYYYRLEELEVGGGSNWYGPGSTNGGTGNTIVTLSAIRAGSTAFVWGWPVAVALAAGVGLLALARLRKRR